MTTSGSSLRGHSNPDGTHDRMFSRKSFCATGSSFAASSLLLAACGRRTETAPLSKLKAVSDTSQPHPSTTPRETSPNQWIETSHQGISFYLPTSFKGPQQRSDWGMYEVYYDLTDDKSSVVQRLLCSGVSTESKNPDGVRQSVNFINKGIIENYKEVKRISWDVDQNNAIERVFFYWGPDTDSPGWTWMIASSAGVGVVTIFGAYQDDGLRNGIESSLSLKGA